MLLVTSETKSLEQQWYVQHECLAPTGDVVCVSVHPSVYLNIMLKGSKEFKYIYYLYFCYWITERELKREIEREIKKWVLERVSKFKALF